MTKRLLFPLFALLLFASLPVSAQQAGPSPAVRREPGRRPEAVRPARAPRGLAEQMRWRRTRRQIERRRPDMVTGVKRMLAKPDFGTLGSESSQPFFSGTDTAWGLYGDYQYGITLQRQADCSLDQLLAGPQENADYTYSGILLQTIPHYEQYLHTISGLTSKAGTFAGGCTETGQPAVLGMGASGGMTKQGNYVGAGFDFENQNDLNIFVVSASLVQLSETKVTMEGEVDGVMSLDLNGDGYPDLVAVGQNAQYTASYLAVLMNNGDGTFATPAVTTITGYIQSLVGGDFNGDGHADLLVSSLPTQTTASLLFYAGKGNGTFAAPVATSTGSTAYVLKIPVDVNKDDALDVAGYINTSGTNATSSVGVLLNNGSGVFTAKTSYVNAGGYGPMAAGDFNGDGNIDLAVASDDNDTITVATGDGKGTFTQKAVYPTLYNPSAMYVTDLDGDGNKDIAVTYEGGGFFAPGGGTLGETYGQALMGNGDATFSTPPVLTPSTGNTYLQGVHTFAVADLNGDGLQDVVALQATGTSGGTISAASFLNTGGKLTYSSTTSFTLGSSLGMSPIVLPVDLNGDGHTDLAVLGSDATTGLSDLQGAINSGTGTFTTKTVLSLGGVAASAATGDFNGDGKQDVAFVLNNGYSGQSGAVGLYYARGNKDGTFSAPVLIDASLANGGTLISADVNGDGKPDLIAVSNPADAVFGSPSTIQVYVNNGSGGFAAPVSFQDSNADQVSQIVTADFNGDGILDLALLGTSGDLQATLYIYTGNKTGKFTLLSASDAGDEGATSLAIADINQDGVLDAVLDACCGLATPQVLIGKGAGMFYPPQAFGTIQSVEGVQAIALNTDAYPDMVFGGETGPIPVINHYAVAPATGKAATTVSSPDPVSGIQGQDLYAYITVSETSGKGVPTGTVTATFNGKSYTSILGQGMAFLDLPTTTSMAGSYPVVYTYGGDIYNQPSTLSSTVSLTYENNLTLTVSPTSVLSGSSATITATLTRPYATGSPTGSIALFYDNGNEVLESLNLVNGVAKVTQSTSGLPVGIYGLAAYYFGDSTDAGASSSTVNVTIVPAGKQATTTSLAFSAAGVPLGSDVTFTVTVTDPSSKTAPSGTVTLASPYLTFGTLPISNGKLSATVPISGIYAGNYDVTATFNGNSTMYESASQPVAFTVQNDTSITLGANPTTVTVGQPVTFYSYVYDTSGYGAPTGTISLTVYGEVVATYNATAPSYTVNTSGLPKGQYPVVAVYNGDTLNGKSSSTPVMITLQ